MAVRLLPRHDSNAADAHADTGERRVVPVDLPAPPSDTTVALAHDGSAIYYGALRIESNIWMVELGH